MTSDVKEQLLTSLASSQWQKIGIHSSHGIVIPLFSLHSKSSCGIGEYPDLIPIINWCKEVGFTIIQLLPLNDTGLETSPYSALSAFALNPIHLGLSQLPYVETNDELKKKLDEMQVNPLQRIDYKSIQRKKDAFLRRYFQLYGEMTSQNDYLQFEQEQRYWLQDYAVFKAIKILQKWKNWEEWPIEYKNPTPLFFQHLPEEITKEAKYYSFLQFLCFLQFKNVKRHAEKEKISLKGDIPILINRESADVWRHPGLFILELTAGAPPDMYSKEGQKWGFPLYQWESLAKENYHWWIERLHTAVNFYDLYRIDHIVGFFRIWAIPLALPAKLGHFMPLDEKKWIPQGEAIMRVMLANCPMLPIGEDLGLVPPEVRRCLRNLGICGTKVMRWERKWNEDKSFINPKDYIPESMTTVSTHDSETLKLWWKNQPQEALAYAKSQGWNYTPELSHDQQYAILLSSHQSGSLFHINLLQEYLALIPNMTWPIAEDERINIPGIISNKNWSYQFKPSVEEIVENEELKTNVKSLLTP